MAVKLTLPEPMRPVPLEMVTQDAPLVAVQLHPLPVLTATLLGPPLTGRATLAGEIVKVQGGAACVMVNTRVPTVIDPVRAPPPVLAATE